MKTYPKISSPFKTNEFCHVFLKYDGSNFRAEWSRKKGWHKFGTRTRLIDESDMIYGRAIQIFKTKYADNLEKVISKDKLLKNAQEIITFGEFFGSISFAGAHVPHDKNWDVVLFDVNVHKKGLLGPKEFLDYFGHLPIAEVVYKGFIDDKFIESIRNETISLESKYKVKAKVPEGVICKFGSGHNLDMFKIKTNRYKEELIRIYDKEWIKHWE